MTIDTEFEPEKWRRQRERDQKRKQLAMTIAAKGHATATLDAIEEVLRAAREAGYLIIDKDRVVDLHTSHHFSEEAQALSDFPKIKEYARNTAARQIAQHMLDNGAIEFEALKGGAEMRSTAYVIWPKPHRVVVRDEQSTGSPT